MAKRKTNPLTVSPVTLLVLGAGAAGAYYFYDKSKKAQRKLDEAKTGRGGTVKKPSTPYETEKPSDEYLSVSLVKDGNSFDVVYDDPRIVKEQTKAEVVNGVPELVTTLTVSNAKFPFRTLVSGPVDMETVAFVRPGEAEIQDTSAGSALFMARTVTAPEEKSWVNKKGEAVAETEEASYAVSFVDPNTNETASVFFKLVE